MRMGEATNNNTQSIADYLAQLLKDKKQLAAFPNVFVHMERLLDDGKLYIMLSSCPIFLYATYSMIILHSWEIESRNQAYIFSFIYLLACA